MLCLTDDAVDQRDFTSLLRVIANRACWGQELQNIQKQQKHCSDLVPWTLEDIWWGRHLAQGLSKQGFSNNCGVFVLMENMLQISKWWCLVLLQNFPMSSEAERVKV
ncbi:hypothetical protein UPYG_G00111440 [Umbra pygmaea]|uniref:Uncharacterized protein n=1 Tax=Umbra pygmaea TaxID=75934 RepID=A0ABD0X2Z1_UMBPY